MNCIFNFSSKWLISLHNDSSTIIETITKPFLGNNWECQKCGTMKIIVEVVPKLQLQC